MRNELQRLRYLFAIALTAAGCGDSDGSSTTTEDCSQACQCYRPPPPEVVRKPYAPKCAAAADAGDAGDASGDAADAADASDAPCEEIFNCDQVCGPSPTGYSGFTSCRLLTSDAGKTEMECTFSSPPCGRMTEGQGSIAAPRDVASWLSSAAWLEASAVEAFERLAHELSFHRAPRELVREASRAARDEVRHARVMAALARREGQKPHAPKPTLLPIRSLEALALENAVEGCVRETFGALLATHQARFASDRRMRTSLARIAADETRHAALAHAIDRWAMRRLPSTARRRIARARTAANAALARELSVEPTVAMQQQLGLPSARRARAMALALARGPATASSARAGRMRGAYRGVESPGRGAGFPEQMPD